MIEMDYVKQKERESTQSISLEKWMQKKEEMSIDARVRVSGVLDTSEPPRTLDQLCVFLKEHKSDSPVLLISLENTLNTCLERLGSLLAIHPLTIEDCLSERGREKLEVFPSYLFILLQDPPLSLLVLPRILISIHRQSHQNTDGKEEKGEGGGGGAGVMNLVHQRV